MGKKPHQTETVIKHKTITNSVRKEKSICAFEMQLTMYKNEKKIPRYGMLELSTWPSEEKQTNIQLKNI